MHKMFLNSFNLQVCQVFTKCLSKYFTGDIIRIGHNHVFRFNHPLEAAKLREQAKLVSYSLKACFFTYLLLDT